MQNLTSTDMVIQVEQRPAGLEVTHVIGEVDIVAAPALQSCVDEQLQRVRSLVLDLGETRFFGAAGLSVLVHTSTAAQRNAVSWAVTGPHSVLRPLHVTGLDRSLPVFPDLEDAIASVGEQCAAVPAQR
ncbi:anti-sigma factor antagonist [Qaidamihabitans albus]|uniref:anti-sigma factor antagonist n=1 Tax=Qaidamihabitans albus TaxID=2795733 RepID=UPI0018F2346B|nr:anti-sigma factor antagonist [Qaidamihabitans albus]